MAKVLVLAHFLGTSEHRHNPSSYVRESWKETFQVQPIIIERPRHGRSTYAVQCQKCGERVEITVKSSRACRFNKVIVAGVLGLVSIAIPIALVFFIPTLIVVFLPIGLADGINIIRSAQSRHKHEIKKMVDGKLR